MEYKRIEESLYPLFFSMCVAIIVFYFKLTPPEEDYGSLLSTAVTFASITLGFLAASQAMIAGHINDETTPAGKVFLIPKYRARLHRYMTECFIALMLFALLNIFGFFVGKCFRTTTALALWSFLGVYGTLCFHRLYAITMKTITAKFKSDKQ